MDSTVTFHRLIVTSHSCPSIPPATTGGILFPSTMLNPDLTSVCERNWGTDGGGGQTSANEHRLFYVLILRAHLPKLSVAVPLEERQSILKLYKVGF